jgi:hypothetical protein
MRCLISTIVRNREDHLQPWANQLKRLVQANPEITFDLSVFENDSTDKTKEKLVELEPALQAVFDKCLITSQDLGWPYFGSIKAKDRVSYLASARNTTLNQIEQFINLNNYKKIICVEPDIIYDPVDISELLHTNDDIASGYSVLPYGMGVPDWIYDSWATRVKADDSEYFGPKISELPFRLPVAATFNCFCVYNAEPFAKGLGFSFINPYTRQWDCDTTNICFEFARSGYGNIAMYKIPVLHKP